MSQPTTDNTAEPIRKTIWTKIASLLLFAFVLVLVLWFDQFRAWAGRYYFERKMPISLTEETVFHTFGKPDKVCVGNPKCNDHISPFVFQKVIPPYTSIFTYTRHYPMVPVLIFFKDENDDIVGYDFGVSAY